MVEADEFYTIDHSQMAGYIRFSSRRGVTRINGILYHQAYWNKELKGLKAKELQLNTYPWTQSSSGAWWCRVLYDSHEDRLFSLYHIGNSLDKYFLNESTGLGLGVYDKESFSFKESIYDVDDKSISIYKNFCNTFNISLEGGTIQEQIRKLVEKEAWEIEYLYKLKKEEND